MKLIAVWKLIESPYEIGSVITLTRKYAQISLIKNEKFSAVLFHVISYEFDINL